MSTRAAKAVADYPTDLQETDPSPAQHRRQALGFALGGVSGLLIGTIAGVLIYSSQPGTRSVDSWLRSFTRA